MQVEKLPPYQVKFLSHDVTSSDSLNCHYDVQNYQVTKNHLAVSPNALVWKGWLIEATNDNKLILHLVDTSSKNLASLYSIQKSSSKDCHIHTGLSGIKPEEVLTFDGLVLFKQNNQFVEKEVQINAKNAKFLRHVRIDKQGRSIGAFVCENNGLIFYRCTKTKKGTQCKKAGIGYANGCNVVLGPQIDTNKVLHKYQLTDNRWFAGLYYTDSFSHFGYRCDFEIIPDFSSYLVNDTYFAQFGVVLNSSEFAFVTQPLLQIRYETNMLKIYAEKFKFTNELGKPLHFMHDLIVFEKAVYSTYYDRGLIFENETIANAFRNGRFYIFNLQSSKDLIMTLFTFASLQLGKEYIFGDIKAKAFNLYAFHSGFTEVEVYGASFADSAVNSNCQCSIMSS